MQISDLYGVFVNAQLSGRIIEHLELDKGYKRYYISCQRCKHRLGRISTHNEKVIGVKLYQFFPDCPECKEDR